MTQLIDASAATLAGLQIDLLTKMGKKKSPIEIEDLKAFVRSSPEQRRQLRSRCGKRETLPRDHYRMTFSYYAPLPPMAQLEVEFGKNQVSSIFDGRPWDLHASCVKMDQMPGERIVWVPSLPEKLIGEDLEAIFPWVAAQRTEFAPHGYRPMIHLEGYQFWKYVLQRMDPYPFEDLVAAGSSALDVDCRYVVVLYRNGAKRLLGNDWFDKRWDARFRFLLVCNEQPLES